MKRIVISLVLLISAFIVTVYVSYSSVLKTGEELKYRVSYLGLTLGHIEVKVEKQEKIRGYKTYKVNAKMRSKYDIPFVELAADYESWLDRTIAFSHQFIGRVKLSDTTWDMQRIDFDYKNEEIRTKKVIKGRTFYDVTFDTDKSMNDGLSILFLARKYTNLKKTIKIPTIIEKELKYTYINFKNRKTKSSIDAVDYDIRTIYFNGKAEWKGVYGLTGKFEGWFSDDSESVPIRAKMKVYIGSIDIELVEWTRPGWKPPRAG